MADAYQGRIVVTVGDISYELTVKAERFTPTVDKIAPSVDIIGLTNGVVIDAAVLAQFVLAIAPTASSELIVLEAKELFSVLEAAGMRPKIGLPTTEVLVPLNASSEYQ